MILELTDFSFGTGEPLAPPATLSLGNEISVLVGKNGSGKTTLLETIALLRSALGGTLRFGTPSQTLSGPKALGYLPAQPIFGASQSVREFLEIPMHLNLTDQTRLDFWVEHWDVRRFFSRAPETLSSGEQQRTALCRLFCVERKLYLMDEPLARLDIQTQDLFFRALSLLRSQGACLLYSAHGPALCLRSADSILFLCSSALSHKSLSDRARLCAEAEKCFETSFVLQDIGNALWLLPTSVELTSST